MTDNEIIKAFEHCELEHGCFGCPLAHTQGCQGVAKEILDLINRQKAEIERLEGLVTDGFIDKIMIPMMIKTAKAEAVKEFAERLKEETIEVDVSYGYGREHYTEAVAVIVIDNLVKEMVGDADDSR